MKENKKMEEEREKEKKGKLHRTVKAQCRGRGLYNNKKCDWIYTYTQHTPISRIKTVQQK